MKRGAALALLLLAAAPAPSDDADRLAAARVDAAAALRATEDQLADLTERIAALRREREAADAAVEAEAARLAPLLPLAERLALYPAATLLSVPSPPEQVIRGVLVLRGLAREIRAQVEALAAQRAQAEATAARLGDARQVQVAAVARQHADASALDAQIVEAARRRQAMQDEAARDAEQAARQAAATAARAASLRAAVTSLDTQAAAPPAKGGWMVPVAGRVVQDFGMATEAGPAAGITYRAPGDARVVAPCPGRAVFAGPFRSYGQLLIVQCGRGLHAVLAGMSRLDAAIGQPVRVGEPIGVMADSGGPLYVEIRRDGVAVDPAPYLRQKG